MEVGTVTVTAEEKQPASGQPDETGKEQPKAPQPQDGAKQDGAKGKDAKPVPERKKARNLSEDKRFKLFSGTANRPLAEEIGRQIGVPVG